MTTTHTQGRLRIGTHNTTLVSDADGPGVRGYDSPSYGGFMVAESVHPENARRLVACWNACIDIPTEALESVQDCDTPVFQLLTQTWEERDAMRALLHRVTQSTEWSCMEPDLQDDIAKTLGMEQTPALPLPQDPVLADPLSDKKIGFDTDF